jgi:hypothetical protein
MRVSINCLAVAMATALLAPSVRGETAAVSPTGVVVTHRKELQATPRQVFEAIGRVDRWWNGQHSYSGDAAKLSLDLSGGGCFCERWDGGSVQHAEVIGVGKDAYVRLQGALGPLQELPVTGVLTFSMKAVDGRTQLNVTYRVAGAADGGLEKWAAAVDRVIGEQVGRLAAFVDTGKPDGAAAAR